MLKSIGFDENRSVSVPSLPFFNAHVRLFSLGMNRRASTPFFMGIEAFYFGPGAKNNTTSSNFEF
jgi:hypothetical protein